MQQDKNDRLVLRITPSLKKSIEELAKKQNVTASELVRKTLEAVVNKNQKEIEQSVLMVKTISKHINSILEDMIFATKQNDINKLTKQLRDYRRLSYSHQIKVITMITEEKNFNDNKTQLLKIAFESALCEYNEIFDDSDEEVLNNDNLKVINSRTEALEDKLWDSAYKLYSHLINKYFGK